MFTLTQMLFIITSLTKGNDMKDYVNMTPKANQKPSKSNKKSQVLEWVLLFGISAFFWLVVLTWLGFEWY